MDGVAERLFAWANGWMGGWMRVPCVNELMLLSLCLTSVRSFFPANSANFVSEF